jgi:hypothetical protein
MAAVVDDAGAGRWDRLVTMTDHSQEQPDRIRTTRQLARPATTTIERAR